jgi:RES domain-containing protein
MAKFPDPPASLTVPATVRGLRAGTWLWRVYAAAGAHPATWNGFRFWGPAQSRFDHHDPPPRAQPKGILYAAVEPRTCLAEVFQATRIVDRAANAPWLVGFKTTRALSLLDLTGTWPTKAGASMAVNTGPRPRAQKWSRAIYAAYPRIDGLLYPSSMNANKRAVALYERAANALPTTPALHRALSDPSLFSRLNAAATVLGYGLV